MLKISNNLSRMNECRDLHVILATSPESSCRSCSKSGIQGLDFDHHQVTGKSRVLRSIVRLCNWDILFL